MTRLLKRGIPALLITAVVVSGGLWWYHGWALEEAFERVTFAEPQAAILRDLGQPTRWVACGKHLYWTESTYLGTNDGRCVTQWRYDHLLTSYAIGFDSEGRVVAKYVYSSE